jgi:hypothetical protein
MRMHTPLLMNSALFVNWPGGNFPEKARRFAGAPRKYYKKSVQILRERKKKRAEGICECRISFSLARHNIAAGCSSSSPAVLLYLHSKSNACARGRSTKPSLRIILAYVESEEERALHICSPVMRMSLYWLPAFARADI